MLTGQGAASGPVAALLICGTSHTGKSTLAARIGQHAMVQVIATDALARHPGRPWPDVRPEVADFYANLSPETIHWLLKAHHENMQCHVHRAIDSARGKHVSLVLEGAALRPELYAPLLGPSVIGICLHAPAEVLRARILQASEHSSRTAGQRQNIEAFIERSLRENAALQHAAQSHGFQTIEVTDSGAANALAKQLAERVRNAS